MAIAYVGAQQVKNNLADPDAWSRHVYDAYISGAWLLVWSNSHLWWVAKPSVTTETIEGYQRLHCSDGPSLRCDIENLYFLHGVLVPDWLVTTRNVDLDPHKILEIDNAEVRREFVRKVGVERLAAKLCTKVHDTRIVTLRTAEGPRDLKYRVLELDYGHSTTRRALEMQNASLPDLWHVEYLPSNITTVDQAMNFRLRREEKDVDDFDGNEFYIHGDRVLVPKGAMKTKRWPALIA